MASKTKGKYAYYILSAPDDPNHREYDGITIGWFDSDEEAIDYAQKTYKIKSDNKIVKLVAIPKCVLEKVY